jgi:diamine N-acetyltransferase
MLERRPVLRDHVLPLIGLSVRPDQAGLVSDNATTLAQAAYETGSYVWGLWDGAAPVGLMAMIHPGEYPWDDRASFEPDTDREAAYLWRLMIGAEFQGKGYGDAALTAAIAQARAWGCPRLTAHVADEPHSNLGFYERVGFRKTGKIEDGEAVILLDL